MEGTLGRVKCKHCDDICRWAGRCFTLVSDNFGSCLRVINMCHLFEFFVYPACPSNYEHNTQRLHTNTIYVSEISSLKWHDTLNTTVTPRDSYHQPLFPDSRLLKPLANQQNKPAVGSNRLEPELVQECCSLPWLNMAAGLLRAFFQGAVQAQPSCRLLLCHGLRGSVSRLP